MKKYKVTSGEYQIIVSEANIGSAAGLAIQLHSYKKQKSELGIFTFIENVVDKTDNGFLSTENLLKDYNGEYNDKR